MKPAVKAGLSSICVMYIYELDFSERRLRLGTISFEVCRSVVIRDVPANEKKLQLNGILSVLW
jgi:hypothetical protein